MPAYKAPLQDMRFLLKDVWPMNHIFQAIPEYQALDLDLIDSILEEAAKFNENILQPLNQSGDAEGCHFDNGKVTTPKGFREAYQQYREAGWLSLNAPIEHGGQGLPKTLQVLLDEMLASSNVSFSLYCVLTQGAVHALELHGEQSLQQTYLPKLISGEWGGTMCLTEPHCGTDLSLIRTKAEPQTDGTYKISGTKIFITSGEHDLTENIVHTVLARIPNGPPGIKGISLFLVPKYLVNNDGSLGARNAVYCGAIEHKMGIRGSATCVMNFDQATGYLMGNEHQGMRAMFDMMNLERINIGLEGLALAEVAYQNALTYAKDRLQGRAAGEKYAPEKAADPLLVHPDVRRMLLKTKALNEGARALLVWVGQQVDISHHHPDASEKQIAEQRVAFLTPIIKAFFTDYGYEACNDCLQVLGGHGYIKEWGLEQFVRDARIAQIYEGANGIQALDLVKRKLLLNQGTAVQDFIGLIKASIAKCQIQENGSLKVYSDKLADAVKLWDEVSAYLIQISEQQVDEAGAASVDYLKLSALILLGWMWLEIALVAKLNQSINPFYSSKMKTAAFYFAKVLPEIQSLNAKIYAGADSLMDFTFEEF